MPDLHQGENLNSSMVIQPGSVNASAPWKDPLNGTSVTNFRSLLLNQREIDYRLTLMEVVNDYPIVENQKQTIVQSIKKNMNLAAGISN